jgi:4-amino-4-deoxy-L-arabinose transferase-like glycosyltransferase
MTTDPTKPVARAWLLALLLAALLSFTGVFSHSLWTPDEPRVAEIGRAMFATGDLVVPRLSGHPFLEKPPLHWWLMSGFYAVFGVSEGVARLPSALLGFLTLLLVFDMARRAAGETAGLFAVAVLATTVGFEQHMHRVLTDPSLAFFVTLGYYAFVRAIEPGQRRPGKWIFLIHVATGFAFLAKGIVAWVSLAGPIVLYVLLTRRWKLLRSPAHVPGILVLAALSAAWPLLLHAEGGRELLDGFLVDNVLNRFLPGKGVEGPGGHKAPFFDYLRSAPPVLLPWLFAVPAMIRRRRLDRDSLPPAFSFLALVLPLGVLLLSVPATKRSLYVLPFLPPAAAAVGIWLAAVFRDHTLARPDRVTLRVVRWLGFGLLGVLAAGAVLLLLGVPESFGAALTRLSEKAPHGIVWLGLGLCIVALGGFALFRNGSVVVRTLLVWCVVFFVVNVTAYRIIDPVKDLRPTVDGLVEKGAFEPVLVGYRLDETTMGMIPFYSGRTIENIEGRIPLREWLAANPEGHVLVFERFLHRLPKAWTDRLNTFGRWVTSDGRVYLVMEVEKE